MMDNKPVVDIRPLTIAMVKDNIDYLAEISAQLQGDYWTLDHYLSEMNRKWELSSATFIDGKLCGFIIVSEKPESLHVHRIVIGKDFQGYGIGKMLINKTVAEAKRLKKDAITLKAEADNTKTIGFYKSLGFEIVGTQAALVLMTLKLAI
jgi:ribosomal protein S18 acetylase RimI-like enzyme